MIIKGYNKKNRIHIKAYLDHSSTSKSMLQSWEFEIICTKCTTVSHVALDRDLSSVQKKSTQKISEEFKRNQN